MTVLHNEIEAKGATLTQAEAEKFARKAGVTEGRKKFARPSKLWEGQAQHDLRDHEKIALTRRRNFAQLRYSTRPQPWASKAHPQARPFAPPWPERSQRRVPIGGHCPKPEETGEAHPRSDADLRPIRRRGPASPRPQLRGRTFRNELLVERSLCVWK
jgi:hypothetical protein